jgi:DegV family protein with EDD domain
MQKVAVFTDSLSGLTGELIKKYDIGIVPIQILIKGQPYRDLIDISPAQAYKFLDEEPENFITSPSSPADYSDAFRTAGSQGRNICCVTVSSDLSNAFNVARLAKKQVEREFPGLEIEVIDSRTAIASEGFVALAAARSAAEDNALADVALEAARVRDRVTLTAVLETMEHVYRTGRIPKVASKIGSALNIKPMLTISSGLVHLKGVVRSVEVGINRMLAEMKKKVGDSPVHVAVMHADIPEEAEKLKKRIESEFNCAELWITEFTPLMGYATGRGTLGLAYYSTNIGEKFIVNYFQQISS